MKDCITHTGWFDDDDNPLDDQGQPYLQGARFCKHRDCVNPDHIEGLSDEAAFQALMKPALTGKRNYSTRMPKRFAHIVHAQVMEVGRIPDLGLKTCSIDSCERPKKARNLCTNHWLMFRYRANDELRKIRQITLADFPELLPALNSSQKTKVAERQTHICLFKDCSDFQKVRGLCKRHYATYKNLQRRAK